MSRFSAIAALKTGSKCSLTLCKLRFFAYFCLALTKNRSRAKVSYGYLWVINVIKSFFILAVLLK